MKSTCNHFLQLPLRYGLFGGLILAVYTIVLYLLEINLFGTFFSLLNMLILIGVIVIFMVITIRKVNASMPEPLNYWKKYLVAFLTGIIAMLIYSVAFYAVFYLLDPEYMQDMVDGFLVKMEEYFINAGLSEEMLQEQMAKLIKRMERTSDPLRSMGTTLLSSLITPGIIGLIVAAAVNTRKHHDEQLVIIDENQE
ncbi:MAG: DUF4199 domain-containing protein [Bacteroidales bacterium]